MGRLYNSLETLPCYIILPFKFMSGYFYFPNNLKDIEEDI